MDMYTIGRRRTETCPDPDKRWRRQCPNSPTRGYDLQGQRPAEYNQQNAKVLQDKREQKLQHRQKYRAEDIQLLAGRGIDDGRYGCRTSSGREVLLPGREER